MSEEIYSRVKELAVTIESPKNYFDGLRIKKGFIPDNILMFCHGYEMFSKYYGYHHRFVLMVPLQSDGKIGADKKISPIKPGQSTLVFPYQIHYYPEVKKEAKWLLMTFEADIVPSIEELKSTVRVNDDKFNEILEKIVSIYKASDHSCDALELSSLVKSLVEHMLTLEVAIEEPKLLSPRAKNLMHEIEQYLTSNIERAVHIKELADRYELSKNYLSALFRDNYGMTLGQYILRLRINHATNLLLTTNLKVVDIAPKCGFESPISFGRSFKKIMNITPKQYRNQFKQKES